MRAFQTNHQKVSSDPTGSKCNMSKRDQPQQKLENKERFDFRFFLILCMIKVELDTRSFLKTTITVCRKHTGRPHRPRYTGIL